MATCNNVKKIEQSEFLASSLFKINTNYTNLDEGLCQLGKDVNTLNNFIRSLAVKDSSTVDMSFSLEGYFLSADVKNNSLGTIKLGQNIPQTTKVFLTAAKISSLIDVTINNVKNENALRWNGTKWINSPLTDEFGAQWLYQLKDCSISNNLVDKEILKYDSNSGFWINDQETGLSALPDGDYEDITVSQGGQIWDLDAGVVNSLGLATDSVATSSVSALQVTNDKFANKQDNNGGIPLSKCAFTVGEVNTGINRGSGIKICLETNNDTRIPIKSLKGVNCTVIDSPDGLTLTIRHDPWPQFAGWTDPPPPTIQPYPNNNYQDRPGGGSQRPTGVNLSNNGNSLFNEVLNTTTNVLEPKYNFIFKTLKGNFPIYVEPNTADTSVIIRREPYYLATSIINLNSTGAAMSDTDVLSRLNGIFPAASTNIPVDAICSVVVETPVVSSPAAIVPNIPVTISYTYSKIKKTWKVGIITSNQTASAWYASIDFLIPDSNYTPPSDNQRVNQSYVASSPITTTQTPAGPSFTTITRVTKKYQKSSSNSWVLLP